MVWQTRTDLVYKNEYYMFQDVCSDKQAEVGREALVTVHTHEGAKLVYRAQQLGHYNHTIGCKSQQENCDNLDGCMDVC